MVERLKLFKSASFGCRFGCRSEMLASLDPMIAMAAGVHIFSQLQIIRVPASATSAYTADSSAAGTVAFTASVYILHHSTCNRWLVSVKVPFTCNE